MPRQTHIHSHSPLAFIMSLRVTSRHHWSPPRIERVLATAAACTVPSFVRDQHFRLVTRESGSERNDLPIWSPMPNIVPFASDSWGPVVKTTVDGVPGAFVLSHVISDAEADALAALSEAMGYTEDAPVSLGRNIRRNENCVIIADDTLWKPVWERVKDHMPRPVDHYHGPCAQPVGLNQRWRLYRYGVDDIFRMHTDGAWPGSALDASGHSIVRDAYGDRWSQLTFLLYLDDDYDGGETTFFVPSEEMPGTGSLVSVSVPKGSVLAFYHGEHELSPLHEGSLVTRGVKRIIRSDVLYTLPGAPALDMDTS